MVNFFNIAFFARTILEGVVTILSVYLLTNSKINKKNLFISGILLGACTYLVRLLPIHFGVHTVILTLLLILLSVKICGIEIYKAVASSIIFIIILFICEWLSLIIYNNLLHFPPENLLNQSVTGLLLTLPPLFLACLIAAAVNFIKKPNKKG